ncbi:MAG TPA: hypothetical protein VGH98_24545 [Gemmatimonadaceae bacterium]|jgi:hypothetical protein
MARKKPRDPGERQPVGHPKLPCIGGPKDGEMLAVRDLPMSGVIGPDGAGGMHVRCDRYVHGA